VVEEVEDAGYSGASLERPGLNRVSDLVAAGGIGVVLAQDRDRIARDPVISGWLKIQFEQHGCKLRALNDPDDDSPTGDLTAGILSQIAKFERAMITQRTRRGRFQRAREGRVNGPAPYGSKYDEDRTNFAPEVTMPTVKRIFEMIAAGSTAYAVKKRFESEGIPSPGGGEWFEPSIRRTILNDAYKPHSHEELREFVARGVLSSDVLAAADPEKGYGVAWFGVNRTTLTPMGDKKRTSSPNPESE
jgi:site-specific DNA recombinase